MANGEFFKAGTSLAQTASVDCQGGKLVLTQGGFSHAFDPDTLGVSQRLGRLPRRIHFPDGSMFSTTHNEQVDQILQTLGRAPKSNWISFFETGWRWTLLAVLVIPVVLFLLFTFGMPLVSAPIASMVSDQIKDDLDRQSIDFLDKSFFEPSGLGLERQQELADKFSRSSYFQKDIKVIFRGGGILGANALALPGGTIVFTDEIVELAEYDGELVAVYMHEVGHVAGNHGLRNLIQTAGVSFILGWMLGDLTMITDVILVGAPVFLQRMVYSRKFEGEADTYAMSFLPISGYSTNCFADMMEKLSTQNKRASSELPDYLSSHPPTRQRINMSRSDQACSEVHSRPGSEAHPGNQATPTKLPVRTQPLDISPPEFLPNPGTVELEEIKAGYSDYSPITKTAPSYPWAALFADIQGHCVIKYTVTKLGTVTDPVVVEDQCTNTLFIDVSIEAAQKFRYKPRIENYKAVDVPGVENKFTFKIMPKPSEESPPDTR